jgi:asparagine synthase (glutamine-hydrolysing)
MEKNEKQLLELLEHSVKKNAPKQEFGILFSGGLDSALLALLCKRLNLKFKLFFGCLKGMGKPKDLEFAESTAKNLNLKLETSSIPMKGLPALLKETIPLINSTSPVQVGVALPLMLACRKAKSKGIKTVLTGMGADELFCGYAKFQGVKDIASFSYNLIQALPKKDLARDLSIASANGLVLRTPFLDAKLTKFALSLPKELKLDSNQNKIILRKLALSLGLPKEITERKKVAAQYGSNFDKGIEKLARVQRKSKSQYLQSLTERKKIAALFSGGKDSCLALWKVQQQGFSVECLVSIIPENPDSFMYHKPNEKILRLQSKALGIPLLVKQTKGEKEKELKELKLALAEAKKKYRIEGVVCGALHSEYQTKRVQEICDALGLFLLSPLWHMGQLEELLELANSGFSFIFTKVAALGLGGEWLGKPITHTEVIALQALNQKHGFNVAGEGGEYESLVLDAPNFKKRLLIKKAEKKMENEFTGFLDIGEARLEEK